MQANVSGISKLVPYDNFTRVAVTVVDLNELPAVIDKVQVA